MTAEVLFCTAVLLKATVNFHINIEPYVSSKHRERKLFMEDIASLEFATNEA